MQTVNTIQEKWPGIFNKMLQAKKKKKKERKEKKIYERYIDPISINYNAHPFLEPDFNEQNYKYVWDIKGSWKLA